MLLHNIRIPAIANKNFKLDGKEYKVGDIIEYNPYNFRHRRMRTNHLIKDVDLTKCKVISCSSNLHINGAIYQSGDEIPSDTHNIEILIKRGRAKVLVLSEIEVEEETVLEEAVVEEETVLEEAVVEDNLDSSIKNLVNEEPEINLMEIKNEEKKDTKKTLASKSNKKNKLNKKK